MRKVAARKNVKIALTEQDAKGVSQTPRSPIEGVRMNKNPIGAINVPKKAVSSDRPGLSNAVK